MPITFDKITQIWWNLHFWIALVKTFRMAYNLTDFSDVRIFHCFGNDIIITLFLVIWSSNLYILWNLLKAISLQSFSSVDCLGQVFQRDYKNKIMTSWWRHFIILGFKISIFVKLAISYQPAKFQIPQLFESNFTEVFIRHPKIPLWRHSQYSDFKIAHFVELNRSY